MLRFLQYRGFFRSSASGGCVCFKWYENSLLISLHLLEQVRYLLSGSWLLLSDVGMHAHSLKLEARLRVGLRAGDLTAAAHFIARLVRRHADLTTGRRSNITRRQTRLDVL